MARARGGFDPGRLAEPVKIRPVIGKILSQDVRPEPEPLRPDDRSLLTTFRGFLSRFEELTLQNERLQEDNAELRAALEGAEERLAEARRSLSRFADVSKSSAATVMEMLERMERAIESSMSAGRLEDDARHGESKRRALELQIASLQVLERAREDAGRRARQEARDTLELVRAGKPTVFAAGQQLESSLRHQDGRQDPVAPEDGKQAVAATTTEAPGTDEVALTEGPSAGNDPGSAAVSAAPGKDEGVAPCEAGPGGRDARAPRDGLGGGDARAAGEAVSDGRGGGVSGDAASCGGLSDVVELTAHPLRDLRLLGPFLQALGQAPGVVGVDAQATDDDAFRITVRHAGPVPPLAPLLALSGFHLRVTSVDGSRVEVALLGWDSPS